MVLHVHNWGEPHIAIKTVMHCTACANGYNDHSVLRLQLHIVNYTRFFGTGTIKYKERSSYFSLFTLYRSLEASFVNAL